MLQVRDITKRFGDVLVLDRINFNLNRGERAGLIGPNGCGKTTLLRIVTGEIAADRGSVQLAPASLRVGYLPQALDWPAMPRCRSADWNACWRTRTQSISRVWPGR